MLPSEVFWTAAGSRKLHSFHRSCKLCPTHFTSSLKRWFSPVDYQKHNESTETIHIAAFFDKWWWSYRMQNSKSWRHLIYIQTRVVSEDNGICFYWFGMHKITVAFPLTQYSIRGTQTLYFVNSIAVFNILMGIEDDPYTLKNKFVFLAGLHKVHPAYRMVNAERGGGGHLLIGYLLCVINSSHVFKLTFFKLCKVFMTHLRCACGVLGVFGLCFFLIYMKLNHFSTMFAGGHLLTGYLLCVINSSHTFRLTFFKPCTVMDTLKMCIYKLFESVCKFVWKIYI
jgi:hypothetical protein